jgi:hypothetical protein
MIDDRGVSREIWHKLPPRAAIAASSTACVILS